MQTLFGKFTIYCVSMSKFTVLAAACGRVYGS